MPAIDRPISDCRYGQEDHRAELAMYLTGAESFTSTAVARHAQLQTGAVAAVAAGAGDSGEELVRAAKNVEEVERWVSSRVTALQEHGGAFHAALLKAWALLSA